MYFTEIGQSLLKSLGDVLKSSLKSSSHEFENGVQECWVIWGCTLQEFLLRTNARSLVGFWYPSQNMDVVSDQCLH